MRFIAECYRTWWRQFTLQDIPDEAPIGAIIMLGLTAAAGVGVVAILVAFIKS